LSPILSRLNHSMKDWRCRQMWLFVLCQEHSTDINYHCWLHQLNRLAYCNVFNIEFTNSNPATSYTVQAVSKTIFLSLFHAA
jgi:hypothetical protein